MITHTAQHSRTARRRYYTDSCIISYPLGVALIRVAPGQSVAAWFVCAGSIDAPLPLHRAANYDEAEHVVEWLDRYRTRIAAPTDALPA